MATAMEVDNVPVSPSKKTIINDNIILRNKLKLKIKLK